ncbi:MULTISPECIES: DUF6907 domain-containing protein [Nocardia]|uniref:DUF6907 domain-containing protein n=1 Tax=Nocardia TaxID=1817 RepID=UPI000D695573|nr:MULTISPECIES: hypothetical protein [Nocardia]
MADVLACPAWCIEHTALDPDRSGDGVHYGPPMSVPVARSGDAEGGDRVVTRVVAFDVDGCRDTAIHLDKPGRGAVRLNAWQARATAVTLLHATDLHDATFPSGIGCPTWCVEDHTFDEGTRHADTPRIVHADGPLPLDSAVSVQVLALDVADTRRVFLDLALPGSHTPLTVAEACKLAGRLLEAADLYTATH